MFYGMSYDDFWNGPPEMVNYYREKHKLEIKAQNEALWLQGFYNFSAISTALGNIHLDGKSHKINKYMEKPLDLFEKNEREKKQEVEAAKQKVIDTLNKWQKAFKAKGKNNGNS